MNIQDNVMGISFCRCEQLKPDMVLGVLETFVQSNVSFGLNERIELHVDHARMPGVTVVGKRKRGY
jgi:hypothetical protein